MRQFAALLLLACAPLAHAISPAQLEQMKTARLTGSYQTAIVLGHTGLIDDADNGALLNQLGELQLEIGNLDAAATRFQQVIDLSAADALMAKLNLAEVHLQRGELPLAEALWRQIRQTYQTQPSRLSARDLYAVANATQWLGRADPQLFKQALRIFDDAARRDPANPEIGIALGTLLLQKYNNREALQVFREVLSKNERHPLALLGLARSQHFDYSSKAVASTLHALSINPNLVAARVFLARLFIELEQYADARHEIDLALQVNPRSLDALATQAVIHHLERNPAEFERIEKQVLELNPRYAEFYNLLADIAAQNRLYQDAEKFAAKALQLDSMSWRGYGLLGINQLRLGRMRAGRDNLERSFAGDPYNIWIKNSLQLADRFGDYVEIEQGHFQFVLHGREYRLLSEYVFELAESAYRHFAARYRHQPSKPIRLELYPDHADFSVRSVGLAGIGLLGVSFGPVVAMDSPSARERGAFNWGSVLWHEIAHVFHLSMTDNRVPRWFSEGLAVHEEHRARAGWGGDVDPGFLQAYLDGKLLPISRLNNGFVRPSYPQQVNHSYFQASLVFDFIETRWGFAVIRNALAAFKQSDDPDRVLVDELQLDAAALDAAFDAYLKTRYATALKALASGPDQAPPDSATPLTPETAMPDKYFDQIELGILVLAQGKLELAEKFFKRAQQLFPEYAAGDSSYWLLAELYRQQGKPVAAERQLEAMVSIDAEHYEAHLHLADLRARRGDSAGAAAALQAAIYIYPYDLDVHRDLAGHQTVLERWHEVARERRAVLALNPVDKAEAYYQLAYAYDRAGDRSSARKQILYALEIAPNFYQAQKLLLSLRQAKASAETTP